MFYENSTHYLAKWKMKFANGIVPWKPIIIVNMEMENSRLKFVDRKTCKIKKNILKLFFYILSHLEMIPSYLLHSTYSTFKINGFIPSRIQSSSFDFCVQSLFFVRKQGYSNIGITQAICIFCCQVFSLKITL